MKCVLCVLSGFSLRLNGQELFASGLVEIQRPLTGGFAEDRREDARMKSIFSVRGLRSVKRQRADLTRMRFLSAAFASEIDTLMNTTEGETCQITPGAIF